MERLVRETVERHHFQPAYVQFPAQPGDLGRVGGECRRDRGGQPQPEPEPIRADVLADRHGVRVELRQDLRQLLTRVYVRAVAQVDGRTILVPQAHQPPPRRIELPSNVGSTLSTVDRSSLPDWP